jgi:hypothetical protein
MNKDIIKDEVKWLIEAINEQYEAIQLHGEKIPQIEFDILMENVRKFYENMHLLQRLNDPFSFPGKKMKTPETPQRGSNIPTEPTVIKSAPQIEPLQIEKPVDSGVTVKYSEPEPVDEKPDIEEDADSFPSIPVQVPFKPANPASIRQETPIPAKKSAKVQEIDLFAAEEPVFSIKLKEAREKTLGPKTLSERIENLKTAISINEKFMFINELFDGNLREYNETIETLNGFKNLDQTADFLDLMRKKNFWNTGSTAFKKLKELVERRF